MKQPKIVIGVPSGDMVHADFAMCLCNLLAHSSKNGAFILGILNEKTSLIPKGRHTIVEKALKHNVDYLLFLDSDMVFPSDLLIELIKTDKDIIGCNYATRRPPFKLTCRNEDFTFFDKREGVHEVGFIGTGALLIKTEVFNGMEHPYFNLEWEGGDRGFDGEDYNFCKRMKADGHKIYCHAGLSEKIGHLGLTAFGVAGLQKA